MAVDMSKVWNVIKGIDFVKVIEVGKKVIGWIKQKIAERKARKAAEKAAKENANK
jgi:hypothetical protein